MMRSSPRSRAARRSWNGRSSSPRRSLVCRERSSPRSTSATSGQPACSTRFTASLRATCRAILPGSRRRRSPQRKVSSNYAAMRQSRSARCSWRRVRLTYACASSPHIDRTQHRTQPLPTGWRNPDSNLRESTAHFRDTPNISSARQLTLPPLARACRGGAPRLQRRPPPSG